jgi:hypothetical protein
VHDFGAPFSRREVGAGSLRIAARGRNRRGIIEARLEE